jgi:hypothetical protein
MRAIATPGASRSRLINDLSKQYDSDRVIREIYPSSRARNAACARIVATGVDNPK